MSFAAILIAIKNLCHSVVAVAAIVPIILTMGMDDLPGTEVVVNENAENVYINEYGDPDVSAHRSGAGIAPQNTLMAFEKVLEEKESSVSKEEFESNFDVFTTEAMLRFVNDDYVIQTMHDLMHDHLYDVLEDYANNKETFLSENRLDEEALQYEHNQEIIEAYRTLLYYNNAEEVLVNNGYLDKEKNDLLEEVGKLMDTEKELSGVKISFVCDDGEEYIYEFTKNEDKKEFDEPSWFRFTVQ